VAQGWIAAGLADASTTITMTVQPQRRGRVVIEGMEVDYARGADHLGQRGSHVDGPVVKVHVSKQPRVRR
jgi:hypothetical protein